jgi:PAS domain S-box-containing protein
MDPEKIRILFVDDDQVDCMAFQRYVEKEKLPYDYVIARSVQEAKQKIRSNDYDLALVDYLLGDGKALDLMEDGLGFPVVIITGSGDEQSAIRVIKAGAADYLIKDPQGTYLSAIPTTVENVLKRRRNQQELDLYRTKLEKLVSERTAELENTNRVLQSEVDQRKIAEKKLLDHQQQVDLLIDNLIDVIWQMDLKLNFTYVSPSIEKLTEYTQEEWVGSNLKDHATWKEFYKMARAAVSGIKNYRDFDYVTIQSAMLRKDGSEVPVEIIGKLMLNDKGFPVGLQGSTREISERVKSEERNRRLQLQQEAAYDLAIALGESHNLDEIYKVIFQHVKNLMDVTSFIISFFNQETEKISAGFVISKGDILDVSALPDLHLGEPGQGTQSRVIHTGEPFYAADYRQAVNTSKKEYVIDQNGEVGQGPPPDYDPEITRSAIYIPLKDQNEVIGVMQVQSYELDRYTQEDIDLLNSLAGVASIAIQNARLIEEEKKRREISETLMGITSTVISSMDLDQVLGHLLQELSRVIDFDTASLLLLDGNIFQVAASVGFEDPELINSLSFPLDDNFPNQEVVQNKGPVMYQDVSSQYPVFKEDAQIYDSGWIHSWLGVPLLVKDSVIGMISVDRKEIKKFSKDEINLAEAFANQAATMIENTRLYSQSNSQLERLETLRQIDQTITSSLDLSLSLNVFLTQLMDQLEVDAAGLYLYQGDLQQLEFYLGKGFKNQSWIEKEIRLSHGLAGTAALNRESIFIKDMSSNSQFDLPQEGAKNEGFVSYYNCPLTNKGKLVGLLEIYQRTALDPNPEWVRFLEMLTRQASIAIESVTQFYELEQSNVNLMSAYDETLEKAVQVLEARGFEPPGHSRRVIDTAVRIGVQMGLSSGDLVKLRRGSLIHDLGMLAMPDSIVLKPAGLDPDEISRIQEHPGLAYEWFSGVELLREALEIPFAHHERWDGTGYPRGLKGHQIPLNARIFSVVDVWDILNSDKPYRPAWEEEKILAYLEEQSGLAFDPDIVRTFFSVINADVV